MPDKLTKRLGTFHFRAQLPKYFRVAAIVVLCLTLIAVGIGYYRAKSNVEFRMVGFPTQLSKDVVASVSGYERREMDGETVKYYIKADTATTFTDNHQELENVYLQVFNDAGTADEITARKAVYVPEENKNFTGYFAGNVVVKNRDGLTLRTEQITYSKATEVAAADEDIEFERLNLKGRSSGASLDMAKRTLELNRNVQFDAPGENGAYSKLSAGNAVYDQGNEKVELMQGAMLEKRDTGAGSRYVDSKLKANRIVSHLVEFPKGVRTIESAELFDNVEIERVDNGSVATMHSPVGQYSRYDERFSLSHGVTANFSHGDKAYEGESAEVIYTAVRSQLQMNGDAKLHSGDDHVSGDSMVALLNTSNAIKQVDVTGNARLRQTSPEFITDISAPNLKGVFDDNRILTRADSQGVTEIIRTSPGNGNATRLSMNAASALHSIFKGSGAVDSIDTEGRTTIKLGAPDNGSDSADRSITADSVKSKFQQDGKSLARAEAEGNAEFVSMAHHPGIDNYNLRTQAPRFDCDFYSGTNNPRSCFAAGGTKTVRTPTVQKEGRGEQTITSNRLTVAFDERTRNVGRMDATGKAKFVELDRNAVADNFSFSSSDEVIQLRGGEPTAWDSKARVKAKEIDWDTRGGRSFFRKSVSSTYYNSQSAGKASPFSDTAKPFYVTAEAAELDHRNEVALFTGNARGWQGNNYIRGEKLELRHRDSQMNVAGGVQSLLYNVRRTQPASAEQIPVFAAANEMHYDGGARTVKYLRDVDIRQGSDRITGASALIQLNERNEMVQTNVDSGVSITQAGRKAFAEAMIYTSADDRLVLRGRPARVDDAAKGGTQGDELVLYLGDNRMTAEGRSKVNPGGRVRTAYKVN